MKQETLRQRRSTGAPPQARSGSDAAIAEAIENAKNQRAQAYEEELKRDMGKKGLKPEVMSKVLSDADFGSVSEEVCSITDPALKLFAGFYLATGSRAVGKTLSMASLYVTLKMANIKAFMLSMNEARSPSVNANREQTTIEMILNPISRETPLFDTTSDTGRRSQSIVDRLLTMKKEKKVIIVDSIALDLRFYDARRGGATRQSSSPMRGGLHMCDIDYCLRTNQIAAATNTCFIGVGNPDLVPFINELEAAAEGILDVTSASTFSKRDRGEHRTAKQVTLPREIVDTVATRFYGARPQI
jgi:hypothetical protein